MRIGIDLGGTKIALIALSEQGETLYQQRMATPKGDYLATVQAIAGLVDRAERKVNCIAQSVGVGIPGAVSQKTGRIKNANSICLIGQDLQGDLQTALNRPVKLANDANCFALSEAIDGAAQGADVVFGVIIGTGCGGALVVNQRILSGANAIAGEWGHNPLPWRNDQDIALDCYCGLQGCNETFLSGSGLERHYQQRGGTALSAQNIEALSEQKNPLAAALLDDYIIWLAKGLASVINVLDPDVIVLGGGMSNVARIYRDVPALWSQWVFSDEVNTRLVPPKFGDASGVRGAAWL
ncbi:ROK family protein [Thiomicrorhabdus aquaedulcis]|uniref:ROK family protein n=1 Tax=Thiomicrorhabdus aquaedulcis TaxID=2211106 RepID=UPI000FDB7FEB|nr:ROK family protein [Thiomicrorhabdus aquaedulcis]